MSETITLDFGTCQVKTTKKTIKDRFPDNFIAVAVDLLEEKEDTIELYSMPLSSEQASSLLWYMQYGIMPSATTDRNIAKYKLLWKWCFGKDYNHKDIEPLKWCYICKADTPRNRECATCDKIYCKFHGGARYGSNICAPCMDKDDDEDDDDDGGCDMCNNADISYDQLSSCSVLHCRHIGCGKCVITCNYGCEATMSGNDEPCDNYICIYHVIKGGICWAHGG